jgi:hypothetical protein
MHVISLCPVCVLFNLREVLTVSQTVEAQPRHQQCSLCLATLLFTIAERDKRKEAPKDDFKGPELAA